MKQAAPSASVIVKLASPRRSQARLTVTVELDDDDYMTIRYKGIRLAVPRTMQIALMLAGARSGRWQCARRDGRWQVERVGDGT